MNRASLLFLGAAAVALWTTACGGSSPIIVPPPNNGFTDSNLQGQYAFSMTGSVANNGSITGVSPFVRAGSFIADGKGGISGGAEDVTTFGSGTEELDFTGGSYTVNSDGRGSLSLIDTTGTVTFSITLASSTNGYIVPFPSDGLSTASGTFVKQNTASFTLAGITGSYAFDISGLDPSGAPESIAGQLAANGTGQFTSGLADDNDGGNINNSSGGPLAISGTYADDSLHAGHLASFGRAVFTIGSLTGVAYIVGPNQLKFMETSSGGTLEGDAFLQSGIPTTTTGISGGFVYVMGGSGVSATAVNGPFLRGGKLSASSGSLSSILVDTNDAGSVTPGLTASSGTYTIDSSGTGRGTISFTISGQNPFSYVFYLISPTQAFVQDQTLNIVEDGSMFAQGTSSISDSSLAGNYAINWSGVTSNNGGTSSGEEDLDGEATLGSSGAVTGTIDLNEFSTLSQATGVSITGSLALNADPTSHNALTINLQTNPVGQVTAFAYIAANNNILILTTQTNRIAAGVMTPQAP